MERQIQLELMTPERLLVREAVDEVIAPGSEGDFGVRAGHCFFLTALRVGELRYRQENEWHHFAIHWGYAQVQPDRVTVLAELAEAAHEIDIGHAEEQVHEAEAQLAASKKRDEMDAARRKLEQAVLRVKMGRKKR
jgi:F-type H+-transporting ATPase subunit epsilon